MSILIALIVFSLIILFHELGHFLLAKLNGITVLEFSLGMGPRLLSHQKDGGTRYSLKLLPFGGSCMMLGEDGEDDGEEGSFQSKSVWARISVVAAGPVFNFILAFFLSLFIVGAIGYDPPVVLGVTEGYPAQEAGLQEGDLITRMNGKRIRLYRQFSNYAYFHSGETIVFEYVRDGETYTISITPTLTEDGYKYGISGSTNYRYKTNVPETLYYSAYEVYYWIDTTLQSLNLLIHGGVTLNDMSGPVGVVDTISETYQESKSDGIYYVWLNMLNIAILLTANLGVMNLLPIPALDGGRLVFLFLEAIRGKRISPDLEAKIHFAGLMALMVLMVVVMINDVGKLI
ncbi:MAG: site-2 protease family protein [Clostridiales bacterium]|nr:site-2 protease family protein [Clostridiales bacterium]